LRAPLGLALFALLARGAGGRAVAFPLRIAEKKIIKSMDRRGHKEHLHRCVRTYALVHQGFGGAPGLVESERGHQLPTQKKRKNDNPI